MSVVSVLGRIGYDLYAEETNTSLDRVRHFRSALGGSSANIAVGLARLGFKVHMLAALSDDLIGAFLRNVMASEGVDISLVQPVPNRTSLCLTEVCPPHGFRQVFYRTDPADARLTWSASLEEAISRSETLITNGTSLCASPSRDTTLKALQLARRLGLTTVFDVDYRESSWDSPRAAGAAARQAWPSVDVLLANAEEIKLLSDDPSQTASEAQIAAEALGNGVKVVIWKQGAEGATCFTPGSRLHVPAFEVAVTSTIGAGDGFAVGFTYAYAHGRPLVQCLRYGNGCAALVVQEVGCAEAMPTLGRLEGFLQEGK
jgi:5-dehydro-2-deoxygluconokinase